MARDKLLNILLKLYPQLNRNEKNAYIAKISFKQLSSIKTGYIISSFFEQTR